MGTVVSEAARRKKGSLRAGGGGKEGGREGGREGVLVGKKAQATRSMT
jgi:hypothetical protein